LNLGEDMNFQLRALFAELLGAVPQRGEMNDLVKKIPVAHWF
jgi:hypothetical protein